ncbi:hypothetical protein IE81DRAFT_5159 [Ceraceosorus guamensis]|uniref:Uncharacterized protein n=1 Tax=Ceraceosorus guamensis TaxID=1522189 RepID=A0A316WGW5_9BASI|nr:hypothetical protein IE81DRAFT_5159 [Ceraceosorus guamensis]PWN46345.1 hypothetical protein IE81DRAFT_5159 [Ceraceosorus guamensis]
MRRKSARLRVGIVIAQSNSLAREEVELRATGGMHDKSPSTLVHGCDREYFRACWSSELTLRAWPFSLLHCAVSESPFGVRLDSRMFLPCQGGDHRRRVSGLLVVRLSGLAMLSRHHAVASSLQFARVLSQGAVANAPKLALPAASRFEQISILARQSKNRECPPHYVDKDPLRRSQSNDVRHSGKT